MWNVSSFYWVLLGFVVLRFFFFFGNNTVGNVSSCTSVGRDPHRSQRSQFKWRSSSVNHFFLAAFSVAAVQLDYPFKFVIILFHVIRKKAAWATGHGAEIKSRTCEIYVIVFHRVRLSLTAKITYWFPQTYLLKIHFATLSFVTWSSRTNGTTNIYVRPACSQQKYTVTLPILKVGRTWRGSVTVLVWEFDIKYNFC